ncbi:DUF6197 family protein [Streptomyces sp. CA-111067]|uniref:DUF6197 family protein n=1 Tax=Streptomyces sp. CA-111067 TaxID=3240046 RepID=UPI003D97F44E
MITATVAPRVPATFRSQSALAAAVDAAFADALARELADVLADAAPAEPAPSRPFGLPETEVLIAQAGITTGPAPRDPRVPSPAALRTRHALAVGGKFAGRAAWVLLKATAYVTALVAREVLVTTWQLLFGVVGQEQREQLLPAPAPTGRQIRPSDFLVATSGEIERRGWTQRTAEDMHGRVCVLGAEQALIRTGTGTRRTARTANQHFRHVTGARSVPGYNDGLRRREDQIHAALLTAAARARSAGQ